MTVVTTNMPPLLTDNHHPTLPEGLRASSWAQCVSKCFIEQFDPVRYPEFHEGVGQAGHDIAHLFIQRVLEPTAERLVSELVIPWKHGASHVDASVIGGDWHGSWELKSTSKNPRFDSITPSTVNRKQVRIMQFLAERAGIELPQPFRIAIVSKRDWSIHGPWTIDLTDDDRLLIANEYLLLDRWMDRADTINLDTDQELLEACTCGSCLPRKRRYVQELETLVDEDYHRLVNTPVVWSEWRKVERQLKELRVQIADVMRGVSETHAESFFYFVTLDSRGYVRIKPRQ